MNLEAVAYGNLTIDDIVSANGAVSPDLPGGNALYAAVGMWIWSDHVGLCAGAGEDYPRGWLARLESAGIDTSGVYEVSGPHQLRSRAFYRPDGSRTDRVAEADLPAHVAAEIDVSQDFSAMGSEHHRRAWPVFSPDSDRIPEAYLHARAHHLAPGPHGNLRRMAACLRIANPEAVLTLDWPWWNPAEDGLDGGLLDDASAVLPGQEELERIAIGGDASACLSRLLARVNGVVVKRGSAGAWVHRKGTSTHVPVVPVTVADPTGAGDAFCGGFAWALARTGDWVAAAAHGAVSASFVVERSSALDVLDADRRLAHDRLEAVFARTSTTTANGN